MIAQETFEAWWRLRSYDGGHPVSRYSQAWAAWQQATEVERARAVTILDRYLNDGTTQAEDERVRHMQAAIRQSPVVEPDPSR